MKKRLFVDMDGTLAVFRSVDAIEELYEQGYFENLQPHKNVCDAISKIVEQNDVEVFVLSAYLSDSAYALDEKNRWLDKYMPCIDAEHRVFTPCGSDKKLAVPDGIRTDDTLLDDYTYNLLSWDPPAHGLKLLNGINHTNGTWTKERISIAANADELADKILNSCSGKPIIDSKPNNITRIAGNICYVYDRWIDDNFNYITKGHSVDDDCYYAAMVDMVHDKVYTGRWTYLPDNEEVSSYLRKEKEKAAYREIEQTVAISDEWQSEGVTYKTELIDKDTVIAVVVDEGEVYTYNFKSMVAREELESLHFECKGERKDCEEELENVTESVTRYKK